MSTPYIKSAVNGIIIPLLPGQAGILHRFNQPENRLVIAGTSETLQRQARPAAPDNAANLVVESTPEPAATLQQGVIPQGVVPGTAIADPDAEEHERLAAAAQAVHTAATPVATPPVVPTFAPPPLGAGFTPPALPGK